MRASALTPEVARREALLACEELRALAWHRECSRRRQKDHQLDDFFDGMRGVAAKHRSILATSGLFGPALSPVELVQQLYQIGELRSDAGYTHRRRLVTDEHRRFADDLAKLRQVRDHLAQHTARVDVLMKTVIGEFEETRDLILAWLPPRSAFPRGGGRPGRTAAAFRWIANFIPHDYATPDTRKHREIIEAIANALGIEYDAATYHGISRTGWDVRPRIRKNRADSD